MNKNTMKLAEPIINKGRYWIAYDGSGDEYRKSHDWACLACGGDLHAATLISLWVPLRFTLNYFEKEKFGRWKEWSAWKDYEYNNLKPNKLSLKDDNAFLKDLLQNLESHLNFEDSITIKLSKLFDLGCQRCNAIRVPYRNWIFARGRDPYFEYMPAFLYDRFEVEDEEFLREWIIKESLQFFFKDGNIMQANVRDLAGTGNPLHHKPADIQLDILLDNYIDILEKRKKLVTDF